jgi:hypothetical protein
MKAACTAIAKNEEQFIDEWAAYHLLIGFDHIYIYDNNDDSLQLDSADFIWQCPNITVIRFPGQNQQIPSYRHSLAAHGCLYDYMAFIDIDEFILPLADLSVKGILENYSHIQTIGLTWSNFGHSGHNVRPSGLVIDNYSWSYPIPAPQIKSLTRQKNPESVVSQHNIDSAAMLVSGFSLQGKDTIVESLIYQGREDIFNAHSIIRINHYITKSLQDLQDKCARGSVAADVYSKRNFDWYFDVADRYNSRLSLEISQLVSRILASLNSCDLNKAAAGWFERHKARSFDSIWVPSEFNCRWYASMFLKEYGSELNLEEVVRHWLAIGITKGYEWSEYEFFARNFNADAYRKKNQDLAHLSDRESYIHFLIQGRFENRSFSQAPKESLVTEGSTHQLAKCYSPSLM